jgi:hypothetical protein
MSIMGLVLVLDIVVIPGPRWLITIMVAASIYVIWAHIRTRHLRARTRELIRLSMRSGLFFSLLSRENQQRYVRTGTVLIRGSSGNMYLIRCGSSGNVMRVSDQARFCCFPRGLQSHAEQAMIGQMLVLETDETKFLLRAVRI